MDTFKQLSDTELQIMDFLWNSQHEKTPSELLSHFNELGNRSWKRQTLSTFLSRLCNKDLLNSKKVGREVYYFPKYTRKEYERKKATGFLDSEYQGSIKNFMTALFSDEISENEINELKEWLNRK